MQSSFKLTLLACAASCACAASPASAQTTGSGSDSSAQAGAATLGEIIVTAQKRSERLNDVPLSIAAATGAQLAKAGVTSPSDLTKVVPGFTYQPSNYGPPVYSIRGVGFFDNTLAASPTVSVYVDQVPLPYLAMSLGTALDLERVEVLKGPQGTLFGQNATGGAINFIAAKPTNAFSYGASAEYARFDQGNVGGFVSGPLSDTVRIRLSARTEQGGAWQKSTTRPDDKLGNRNFTTGRLLLDWDPNDATHLEFNANGWIDKSETQAAQFVAYAPTRPAAAGGYTDQAAPILAEPVPGSDSRLANWDANTSLRRDSNFYQFSLNGDFKISPALKLNTISAYSHLKEYSPTDADGTSFQNILDIVVGRMDTFYQEVRLSGDGLEGKVNWMLGGNYAYADTKDQSFLNFVASNSGIGPFRYTNVVNINDVKSTTWAGFGSVNYKLTETLLAQASARYTSQTQHGSGCLADGGNGTLSTAFSLLSITPFQPGQCVTFNSAVPPVVVPGAPLPLLTPVGGRVRKTLDETNFSWRFNLSWKPNPGVHLYANVTKGYKSGSFSRLPDVFDVQYTPVPQESVLAYETGFKLSAPDHKLDLSGAAFYYQYNDKQILGYLQVPLFGNLPGLVTVPKSHVTGGELNANWRPVSGLTLNGGVTYINAVVNNDQKHAAAYDTFGPDGRLINIQGFPFPITPHWQGSGDADYTFPLSDGLNANVGANITYRSRSFSTFGGGPLYDLPAYTLVDLRAGIGASDDRWRFELWGRNVFNKFYLVNVSHVVDTVARITGRPATFGVTLTYRN